MEKSYVDVQEVSVALGVSLGKAYQVIRSLNAELKQQGYITVADKCSRKFFEQKYYGYEGNANEKHSKSIR